MALQFSDVMSRDTRYFLEQVTNVCHQNSATLRIHAQYLLRWKQTLSMGNVLRTDSVQL